MYRDLHGTRDHVGANRAQMHSECGCRSCRRCQAKATMSLSPKQSCVSRNMDSIGDVERKKEKHSSLSVNVGQAIRWSVAGAKRADGLLHVLLGSCFIPCSCCVHGLVVLSGHHQQRRLSPRFVSKVSVKPMASRDLPKGHDPISHYI
jgi:hypothetical protein